MPKAPARKAPIVVGLDPSLGSAAVVGGSIDLEPVQLNHVTFVAGDPEKGMLGRMNRWFHHAISIRQGLLMMGGQNAVTLVMLEGYSFGSNGRSILDLAEFGAILRKELMNSGLRVVEVSPSSLKQFITGKGNANKTEVVAALARKYRIEYKTNDEYDALGLWLIGKAMITGATANASQNKVLDLLRKDNPKLLL